MKIRKRYTFVGLTGLLLLILSQTGGASSIGATVRSETVSSQTSHPSTVSQYRLRNSQSAPNPASDISSGGLASVPDWLEPRGISVVDLVGQVPEGYLHGMILSYETGSGIVVYESGSRVGNTVVVTTTIYPRVYHPYWPPHNLMTVFGCLGQKPAFDHMGSVVPESTMRVYDSSGQDVTSQIVSLDITITGLAQPIANSEASVRYPVQGYGEGRPNPLPMGPHGLVIPTNSGCLLVQPAVDNYPLTGVFTFSASPAIDAAVVGSQQATFLSYIGPGTVGIFQPLMNQLRSAYPDRHGRIPLSAPPEADYFLVRFPPQPGDPFADLNDGTYDNADRPSAGTYRLSRWVYLSTDLIFSAAFPLNPAWKDADRSQGADFLPLLEAPDELAPPEYVLPAGIPYNNCFTQGNCPSGVLQQIYNAEMVLDIIYLSVGVRPHPGDWVSLRLAGPAWFPGGSSTLTPIASAQPQLEHPPHTLYVRGDGTETTHWTYFPYVEQGFGPDEPIEYPCGWFDSLGRMLYYLPGP